MPRRRRPSPSDPTPIVDFTLAPAVAGGQRRASRSSPQRAQGEVVALRAAHNPTSSSETMPNPAPPADYEELIRVIHERHDDMSKSYQRIAVYLTQNPNDVAVQSVNAIAERCGVLADMRH